MKANILQKKTIKFSEDVAIKMERRLKYFIKPKPKLMPLRLWKWLVEKMIRIEIVDKWL